MLVYIQQDYGKNNLRNNPMDEFDEYKYMLGETVMLYQFVENDLKLIYAGLMDGNYYQNIEKVRATFKGLGQVIQALEALDNSDGRPYFNRETYELLNRLARYRNFYCHQCCVEFCYNPDFRNSVEFKDGFEKLKRTNESIKYVQEQTQKFRLDVLRRFKGIKQ